MHDTAFDQSCTRQLTFRQGDNLQADPEADALLSPTCQA